MKLMPLFLSLMLTVSFTIASEVSEEAAAKCEIAYEKCQALCDNKDEKGRDNCYAACDEQFESCLKKLGEKEQ